MIELRPKIRYPERSFAGARHVLTVDVEHDQLAEWPYEREDYPITCVVEADRCFEVEEVGEPVVVVHRFGGSYGAAEFVLVAQEAGEAKIFVTLQNESGIKIHRFSLPVVVEAVAVAVDVPQPDLLGRTIAITTSGEDCAIARMVIEAIARVHGFELAPVERAAVWVGVLGADGPARVEEERVRARGERVVVEWPRDDFVEVERVLVEWLWANGFAAQLGLTPPGPVVRFAGREAEVSWLMGKVIAGSSVLLVGDEGVGRASIIREALSRMERRAVWIPPLPAYSATLFGGLADGVWPDEIVVLESPAKAQLERFLRARGSGVVIATATEALVEMETLRVGEREGVVVRFADAFFECEPRVRDVALSIALRRSATTYVPRTELDDGDVYQLLDNRILEDTRSAAGLRMHARVARDIVDAARRETERFAWIAGQDRDRMVEVQRALERERFVIEHDAVASQAEELRESAMVFRRNATFRLSGLGRSPASDVDLRPYHASEAVLVIRDYGAAARIVADAASIAESRLPDEARSAIARMIVASGGMPDAVALRILGGLVRQRIRVPPHVHDLAGVAAVAEGSLDGDLRRSYELLGAFGAEEDFEVEVPIGLGLVAIAATAPSGAPLLLRHASPVLAARLASRISADDAAFGRFRHASIAKERGDSARAKMYLERAPQSLVESSRLEEFFSVYPELAATLVARVEAHAPPHIRLRLHLLGHMKLDGDEAERAVFEDALRLHAVARTERAGRLLDLSRCDLREFAHRRQLARHDLHGAILDRTDLSGADLAGALLAGASLRHANLGGADLSRAILQNANLSHANLYGASLRGADLRGANFDAVDFDGVDLERSVSWLHLADLHFRLRGKAHTEEVLEKLLADVAEQIAKFPELRPDFIALTGDLSFSGRAEELAEAERFLTRLAEVAGLGPNLERVFVVPGNHDVDRAKHRGPIFTGLRAARTDEEYHESIEALLDGAEQQELIMRRLQSFSAFTERFPESRRVSAQKLWWADELTTETGLRIGLVGLNSVWASGENEEDVRGWLAIGEKQARAAMRALGSVDLRFALMHHGLDALHRVDARRVGVVLDDGRCAIVLRGHKHEFELGASLQLGSKIAMLTAGASYEWRWSRNNYLLARAVVPPSGPIMLRVRGRAYEDDAWRADVRSYLQGRDTGEFTLELPRR